jgi:hypothetical protein
MGYVAPAALVLAMLAPFAGLFVLLRRKRARGMARHSWAPRSRRGGRTLVGRIAYGPAPQEYVPADRLRDS